MPAKPTMIMVYFSGQDKKVKRSLADYCIKTGVSASYVIREAIKLYIDHKAKEDKVLAKAGLKR